jgi:flagellin
MESTIDSLQSAVDNVGDAQSLLGVAEGAYQTTADTLTQIKENVTRANDGSYTDEEKTAIAGEVNQLVSEIGDISTQTNFNGTALFDGTFSGTFQVGESQTESMNVSFGTQSLSTMVALSTTYTASSVADIGTSVDAALSAVNAIIGKIGAQENRLTTKEANLNTSITNTQAAMSRIMDADVASEEIAAVKDQILQQTATAQLSQANQTPQVFLSLFK